MPAPQPELTSAWNSYVLDSNCAREQRPTHRFPASDVAPLVHSDGALLLGFDILGDFASAAGNGLQTVRFARRKDAEMQVSRGTTASPNSEKRKSERNISTTNLVLNLLCHLLDLHHSVVSMYLSIRLKAVQTCVNPHSM